MILCRHTIKLIPPLTGTVSNYDLRNRNNITILSTRTEILHRSCISSSIALWNSLKESSVTIDSVGGFNTFIKNLSYTHISSISAALYYSHSTYYFTGDMYIQYYAQELEIAVAT